MKPRFADINTWRQAEVLMQPAFIRLIDNLRRNLEATSWKGTYHNVLDWADGIPEETKARVMDLQAQLETATLEQAAEIEATLEHLPQPYPGYELHLEKDERTVKVDLWEVCYRVCFRTDDAVLTDDRPVHVDTDLIEAATGEVDWNLLEEKTKGIVDRIFATLPS